MFRVFVVVVLSVILLSFQEARTNDSSQFVIKIKAKDKFERSVIANIGVSIEQVFDDYVVAFATLEEKNQIQKLGWLLETRSISALDFPPADSAFHNYDELVKQLNDYQTEYPTIAKIFSIGKSTEGREVLGIRINSNQNQASQLPAIAFMGGHHSREHLSVEMPLLLIKYLLEGYKNNNPKIVNLINNRDIQIVPAINPDGLEYDISGERYKYWRKNRKKNKDGTYGVDLNRNYGFKWGTGGSSTSTSSDVYMGTAPFSEIETQNVKNWIESQTNVTTLLSFHTFSQLILYPWGHKYASIEEQRDFLVHKTMAETMAKWNGYTPEQSSALYIASGDTTDWSYGVHKIISFTFELDPNEDSGYSGFYPGADIIPNVVAKNIEPCLYLIEKANDPYQVLNKSVFNY